MTRPAQASFSPSQPQARRDAPFPRDGLLPVHGSILFAALCLAGCLLGDPETTRFDLALTEAIEQALIDETEANLLHVNVYTEDAVVYLEGDLPLFAEKQRAEEVARMIPGVKKVINKIQVEP